jgi:SulP family sulfate permease
MKKLAAWIPLIGTLRGYERRDLRGDLQAGLTTAVMLVPQAMAYAMLAGLDPIIGLYASVVPVVLYALFGSSRQLAVGPVAMVSLLVATGVGGLAEPGSPEYLALAITLAGMVGLVQLAMGVLRLGALVRLLSHPVVSGFTSAAALIIGFSQLKHLLGVPLERSHHVHSILLQAVSTVEHWHPATMALGGLGVALLVALKKLAPRFPRALAVVVLGVLAVLLFGLEEQGVAIVGSVPAGLPMPAVPGLGLESLSLLAPTALTIALVSTMESVSVAKAIARKNRYAIDADKELVGLGVANLGAALFGGYPVTGGFSRTAVNDQAGARTPVASLVTAAAVALTLLLLTPLFHDLPKAALAAIIMTAVFGLVDLAEVRHLWRVSKPDLALLLLTFVGTLGLGIEPGIALGVGASVVAFLWRQARPRISILGREEGTERWRDVSEVSVEEQDEVLALRVHGPLFFANADAVKQAVERALVPRPEVRAVLLSCTAITEVDASADAMLHELLASLERQDLELHLAGVRPPLRRSLERSHLLDKLGPDRLHGDCEAAVRAIGELGPRASAA